MTVLIIGAIILLFIIIAVKSATPPKEELTDEYFKMSGVTVWLKEGAIEFGGSKMDIKEVRSIAIEPKGFPNKLPTVVIYFDSLQTSEWEIAQYTTNQSDKANTVMRRIIVAIEKAGGPRLLVQ
jgi:hypothetical protein